MAVCNTETGCGHAIQGGSGGTRGLHGAPGEGGKGGKGGHGYSYSTGIGDHETTHHVPGGSKGRAGNRGRIPTTPLKDGQRGVNGQFHIHILSQRVKQFSCARRYDLCIQRRDIYSIHRLHATEKIFQFTDRVHVDDMSVCNQGGMVSPIQESRVFIKNSENIQAFPGHATLSKRIQPDQSDSVSGSLSFRVLAPDIRSLGDDIDPVSVIRTLQFGSTQTGPNGFAVDHSNFDNHGVSMAFRFPVENRQGFQGLSTIRAGDGMRIKFEVCNTSLDDLGVLSPSGRQLFVQFYRNPSEAFTVLSSLVDMTMDSIECFQLDENTDSGPWRGTKVPIELLKQGETVEMQGTLQCSSLIQPYARLGLQAEIVLQDLTDETDEPIFLPIQRRQLEVKTEPHYAYSSSNHIVLVTSGATTMDQFTCWSSLIRDDLNLGIEYFSVSIYGTLDPSFELSNGMTLAEAFKRKLVVILDDVFNPLDDDVSNMRPSMMLPNGCQFQTSGYDESTKWFIAGSNSGSLEQALLCHFTAPAQDMTSHDSTKSFKKAWMKRMEEERKAGCVTDTIIVEEIIKVPLNRHIHNKASRIKMFLEKEDPLRQWIVETRDEVHSTSNKGGTEETKYRLIHVRRGYCRVVNSTIAQEGKIIPEAIHRLLPGILEALPMETLHLVFSKSASKEDGDKIQLCLNAMTQALLWDVANFVDGRLSIDPLSLDKAFPSIFSLSMSNPIQGMLDRTDGSSVVSPMSKLLARFQCVAESRDLLPWYKPTSKRHALRKALRRLIKDLEESWSGIRDQDITREEFEKVNVAVHKHLNERYGKLSSKRIHGRWRKGMYYVFSFRNKEEYPSSTPCYRLCDLESGEYDREKKARAMLPKKQLQKESNCRDWKMRAQSRSALAARLLASTQIKRLTNELTETEIEVDNLWC